MTYLSSRRGPANLMSFPDSTFTRNLITLGTYGQRNNIDCAMPNEALEVAKKVPKIFLLMKNQLQHWPEKETHNPEQKRSCFLRQQNSVIMTSSCLSSASTFNVLTPPEGVNYSIKIIFAFGLHVKYEEESTEYGVKHEQYKP